MELQLDGNVVFVTGASGGIGRALARCFATERARLALLGHTGFEAMRAWIAEQPWRDQALALRADVSAPAELETAFDAAALRFGRVDHVVANAGVWPPEDVPLWELSDERVARTLGANLLGAMWTARAFLRRLAQTGPRADGRGASLTFIGSTAARFGERGHCDYAASKAALLGLMRSLKNEVVELDPYARVNVIEPGWTVTEMTRRNISEPGVVERVVRTMPLRQLGRAVDVARAAVFLASPAASGHVSGQVLTVAGGMEGRVRWEADEVDAREVLGRLEREG